MGRNHLQPQVLRKTALGRASTGQYRPLEGGTEVPVPAGSPATRENVNTARRKHPDGEGRQERTRPNDSVVSEIKHHPACIYIGILIVIICLHLDAKIPETSRSPGRSRSHWPVTSIALGFPEKLRPLIDSSAEKQVLLCLFA